MILSSLGLLLTDELRRLSSTGYVAVSGFRAGGWLQSQEVLVMDGKETRLTLISE
jgi:hypothetical protein